MILMRAPNGDWLFPSNLMYGPCAIDRYLAFHGPRLIGFDPKRSNQPIVAFATAAALGVAAVVLAATLSRPESIAAIAVLLTAVIAFCAIALRSKRSKPTRQDSYLTTLYHQVYGQYGWNEDAGPHRSTEPVPIRSARNLLSEPAFEFLDQAAAQALRIHSAANTSDLAKRARSVIDRKMKQFFEMAPGLQDGVGNLSDEARLELSQMRELADRIAGVAAPTPALTTGTLSPLESLLFDARAEYSARLELSETSEPNSEIQAQQQQQQ